MEGGGGARREGGRAGATGARRCYQTQRRARRRVAADPILAGRSGPTEVIPFSALSRVGLPELRARVETLLADNRTVRVRGSHDLHFARTGPYVRALLELGERAKDGLTAGEASH